MKIEFDPWKLLIWFLVDTLYWLPIIGCVAFTADTLGYHSDGWQWWIAILIGWRWISWGNTLHLKYKEAYPDD